MAYQYTLKSFITFLVFVLSHENVFGVFSHTKPFPISLEDVCKLTPNPKVCFDTISPLIKDIQNNYNPETFYGLSIQATMNEISSVAKGFAPNGTISKAIEKMNYNCFESHLERCRFLLDLAMYNLNHSLAVSNSTSFESRDNMRTWVSAADADLQTCINTFEYAPSQASKVVTDYLKSSSIVILNCLTILQKIVDHNNHQSPKSLKHDGSTKVTSDWQSIRLSPKDRALLETPRKFIQANIIVAVDGSGNYRTINEAIKAAPSNSYSRFFIYVKKGVYYENVVVNQTKWNLMIFGDGKDYTIVSGNLSNATGICTAATATFGVYGYGFIARDMGFQNTAGPGNGQAVAVSAFADQSVFYNCLFDGYQDTLYAHSGRQFYRECIIYGTIDFIFGYAGAVFQNCSIVVKKPLPGQFNAITANGRRDPMVFSGFTLQKCQVYPAQDLGDVKTYLGRPWEAYSTVVYMESGLGSLIDPQGWAEWIPGVTPPSTIYYLEYSNTGPGSVTSNRIQWPGLRLNPSADEASQYTVRSLIGGDQWLPATGVPYELDV